MEFSSILAGVLVVAVAVGSKALVDRRRARLRADVEDGVEADRSLRAAARTFPFSLVLVVGLGTWLVVRGDFFSGFVAYGMALVLVIVYWVNDWWVRRAE